MHSAHLQGEVHSRSKNRFKAGLDDDRRLRLLNFCTQSNPKRAEEFAKFDADDA